MNTQQTYRLLFWVLAVVGLAADQASKYAVFAWLRAVPSNAETQQLAYTQEIIPHVFRLVANHESRNGKLVECVNHGALFGWMQGWEDKANAVFAVISLLAAAAIIVWVAQPAT